MDSDSPRHQRRSVGLFADQKVHKECADALRHAEPPRILSPFVLAELDYLILKFAGVDAELLLLEEIERGVYDLASFDRGNLEEARDIIERYRSRRLGLPDASIVVLAGRYDSRDVLTLDERHFRAIRPAARRHFCILPTDAK